MSPPTTEELVEHLMHHVETRSLFKVLINTAQAVQDHRYGLIGANGPQFADWYLQDIQILLEVASREFKRIEEIDESRIGTVISLSTHRA